MEKEKLLTVIKLDGVKYYLKYNDNYSNIMFYTKEGDTFVYVGDDKNAFFKKSLFRSDKTLKMIINNRALSLILSFNIILSSLSGASIVNAKDILESASEIVMDNHELNSVTVVNIKMHDMEEYEEIIAENEDLFNEFCEVIENNLNIPDELKSEAVSTFPRLMLAKEYIDFDNYFARLAKLEVVYDYENLVVLGGTFGITPNQSGEAVPLITIYNEAGLLHTFHHEMEHFNSFSARPCPDYRDIYFNNNRFELLNPDETNEAIWIPCSETIFQEGLTELFTISYHHDNINTYYDYQQLTTIFTYIVGQELMLEYYHSPDHIVFLLNHFLDLGLDYQKVINIFTRISMFTDAQWPSGNIDLGVLRCQIADDLIFLYESINDKSFMEDEVFSVLLDSFIKSVNSESLDNLQENVLDNPDYTLYKYEEGAKDSVSKDLVDLMDTGYEFYNSDLLNALKDGKLLSSLNIFENEDLPANISDNFILHQILPEVNLFKADGNYGSIQFQMVPKVVEDIRFIMIVYEVLFIDGKYSLNYKETVIPTFEVNTSNVVLPYK